MTERNVTVLAPHACAGLSALVTGAGTGIGRAVTLRLLELGARVTGVGRHEETLAETGDLAGAAGPLRTSGLRRPRRGRDHAGGGAVRYRARPRPASEQRRRAVLRPSPRHLAPRLERGDRPQPDGDLQCHQGGLPFLAESRGKRREHLAVRGGARRDGHGPLHRRTLRGAGPDPIASTGVGRRRHPAQLHRARHRHHQRAQRGGQRPRPRQPRGEGHPDALQPRRWRRSPSWSPSLPAPRAR